MVTQSTHLLKGCYPHLALNLHCQKFWLQNTWITGTLFQGCNSKKATVDLSLQLVCPLFTVGIAFYLVSE